MCLRAIPADIAASEAPSHPWPRPRLVDDRLIVEVKSIERLARVHIKQTLTYLRLLDLPLALVITFRGATFKEGVKRVVNGRDDTRSSPLRINQPPG